jgi:ribose-phosphate pyrophosphokinase
VSAQRLILPMAGNEAMAERIARAAGAAVGALETRRFPDEESYVRLICDPGGARVDIVCTLARPDAQILPLIFAADAARAHGAVSVNLIAPYLAYMRQDTRFMPGEAVTAASFARLVSQHFDSLLTVDPHLHRISALGDIYAIPARALHAAPLLGTWIKAHVAHPIVLGPDAESAQWAAVVAASAEAPHLVLNKQRLGDRRVVITAPDLSELKHQTPVLIDDIASSASTMIEAARLLASRGHPRPHCLIVHALFAPGAYEALGSLCASIVSTDSVAHASNQIGLATLLAHG